MQSRPPIPARIRPAIAACALLFGAAGAAPSCARARSEEAPPAPAGAPAAASQGAGDAGAPARTARFVGVLAARRSAELAPRLEGQLEAVHVRIGDRVPAEGLVATLDRATLRLDVAIADADVKAAALDQEKAALALTQAEESLERGRALAGEALISGEKLAAARHEQELARLQVQAAGARRGERQARAERLRRAVGDAEIRAPFAGVVAARYVDPGASVGPARPVVRLISADDMLVRFAVPEDSVAGLAPGRAVRVYPAGAAEGVPGRVEQVSPEVDAASRMVMAEAAIDPAEARDRGLLAGAPAEVELSGAPRAAAGPGAARSP